MNKYDIYKVTKTLPPPEPNNNHSLDEKTKPLIDGEIKYLPCLKLLELYRDCSENYKDSKIDCSPLLITAVIKCGV